jgi:SMI1 / KNR4 family (SUKH-1)
MTWNRSGFDDLIARVRAHAAATGPQPLPPAATDADLAEAERQLGFSLHPLLRRLYAEVADGGFGPEYFLLPLAGDLDSVVDEYAARTAERVKGRRVWPAGIAPILTYGCGMYAGVDCTDPNGAVLLYEPNGGPDDPAESWFLDADNLAAWLETWLADAGWYREESDLDEQPQELFLWGDAPARLAADAW